MKNAEEKLKEIHNIVSKLSYSDDAFLDIINYLNEAIEIAEVENPDRWNNPCLNNLLQTREKQLDAMKNNFKNQEQREYYFVELKQNFMSDISGIFRFYKFPLAESE